MSDIIDLTLTDEEDIKQELRGNDSVNIRKRKRSTTRSSNHFESPTKRVKRSSSTTISEEPIIISSDDDSDVVILEPPLLPRKRELSDEPPLTNKNSHIDEDEDNSDYDECHDGWPVNFCWETVETKDVALTIPVQDLKGMTLEPATTYGGSLVEGHFPSGPAWTSQLNWISEVPRARQRPWLFNQELVCRRGGGGNSELNTHLRGKYLHQWYKEPQGSGSGPNVIIQSGGLAVFGSSVAEGMIGPEYDRVSAANTETLVFFRHGIFNPVSGHSGDDPSPTAILERHYNVNDTQFSPVPSPLGSKRLLSCGADRNVLLWDVEPDLDPSIVHEWRLPNRCQATILSFFDSSSMCAMGADDGSIFFLNANDYDRETFDLMQLSPRRPNKPSQPVAAISCGHDVTKNKLFASSGERGDSTGYHRAYQVTPCGPVEHYSFEVTERGGTLEVCPFGQRAVLTTCGGDGEKHTLRIFDVGRNLPRCISGIPLQPFRIPRQSSEDCSVNTGSFSPDGTYILLARSDDMAQIYDSRYLKRPLQTMIHPPGESETSKYGIVEAFWVAPAFGFGSALGVVTGGGDGCIRLWDIRSSQIDPAGELLATLEAPVASFHLGNLRAGDAPLVAGDCRGMLYVYGLGKPLGP